EGIVLINKCVPQVVFLDIEMPRMDGFEMLHQRKDKRFHLIFTTAYDQYAIKAIKYAAFDYLLKPIDIGELQTAIQKVEQLEVQDHTTEKIDTLQQNLSDQFHLHKIAIPTMEGLLFFNLADIIYLQAENNYSTIYFKEHPKLLTTKTLRDFEEILPPNIFYRSHHSYIINLNYIKRYIKGDGGQIEMANGHVVDLARSRKEEFMKLVKT